MFELAKGISGQEVRSAEFRLRTADFGEDRVKAVFRAAGKFLLVFLFQANVVDHRIGAAALNVMLESQLCSREGPRPPRGRSSALRVHRSDFTTERLCGRAGRLTAPKPRLPARADVEAGLMPRDIVPRPLHVKARPLDRPGRAAPQIERATR